MKKLCPYLAGISPVLPGLQSQELPAPHASAMWFVLSLSLPMLFLLAGVPPFSFTIWMFPSSHSTLGIYLICAYVALSCWFKHFSPSFLTGQSYSCWASSLTSFCPHHLVQILAYSRCSECLFVGYLARSMDT